MSKASGELARFRRGRVDGQSLSHVSYFVLIDEKGSGNTKFYQMEQTFELQTVWLDLSEHDGESAST